ncbi:UDP-N-acetylmuramate dehydrogenase [Vibrio sp. J1-1]|uniref:UDP-N-acetylmuramate dehydrogenase n=1 Tax=Vibrio sp. J1-1 TaxID=2912251 RepID=UPI001EFFD9BA|nr:UDP-N-acetylmuramate dehydrogenase [Vibrio sp. J1-1]MBR9876590.1 UDP-N-acetylmuramate dehydrogenase [Vibrionaceae bacterium]MCF7484272.1 UDP-N-acetylmuramate dehydrogenase [Vibrio sp. J1-1]
MQIKTNASLKAYHTFGIEQTCSYLAVVESVDDVIQLFQDPAFKSLPKLFLGKGSNVLFTEHYQGLVIINRLSGKVVKETDDHYLLHIEGGEDWPDLVSWCVERGLGGIENLALIPGCTGSAPIQNIGAYGLELKDVCDYVDILDLKTFETRRMSTDECEFGYRDSIFKNALYGECFICAVGLKLNKEWKPINQYGPLQSIPAEQLSPVSIFERVCQVRQEKLPDPAKVGNAGSFFKNPVISQDHYDRLIETHHDLVAYPVENGMKVAAGWLIDQCGLKGISVNGAQVNPLQALVLTNVDSCSAQDVLALASLVKQTVWNKYQIELEHEVRFINRCGETNLAEIEAAQ